MLLLVSAALAGSAHPAGSAPSSAEGLLASIEAHLTHSGPDGCLTPLVHELKERADELTPEERAWATAALMPWKGDLLDPVEPLAPAPPPPGATPTLPCFSLGENRITSDHFAVEWDSGTIDQGTAEDFIESLEEGYAVQVGELGWREPLQNSSYLVLAYVQEGNYQGAYTYFESCGIGIVPYIVAYEGSFTNRSWAETMAVHELNHALQFGYGFAWEFWWWEATATYIESLVYPNADWWAGYVSGYSNNPHLAFNASGQDDQDIFWHMYGMAIWAFYLDEYEGGPDTVLGTWEAARGADGGAYSFGMDDAMEELEIDFDAAYADFVVRNTVMDYADQNLMPDVAERDSIGTLPATREVDGSSRPQGYGQTYIRFEADAGDGNGDLVVTFEGDDVPWLVQLVEVDRTDVLRVTTGDIVEGVGTVTMEGFGAEDVVLVASPLVQNDTKRDFTWSAELVEPVEPPVEDEDPAAACGCRTGGPDATVGIGALLGLAVLARRRR